ncbi:cell envelope integrity protein TolA [Zymobacter palmae]|nr:cell envelope integrity protein TolA [Zymobacter palmae]
MKDRRSTGRSGLGVPILLALGLHGALFTALAVHWNFPSDAEPPQPLVQATLVGVDSGVPQPDRSAPASQAAPNARKETPSPAPKAAEENDVPEVPAVAQPEVNVEAEKATQEKAKADAEVKAQADKAAQEKAKADAEAKAQAEKAAQEKAKADTEAKAQAEKAAQEKAKADADAKAKADKAAQEKAKADADAKAKADKAAQEKAKADADAKAKADKAAQEKAKADADAKAKAEKAAQEKAKADAARRKKFAEAAAAAAATDDGVGQEQKTRQNAQQAAQAVNGMQALIHKAVEQNWYHLPNEPAGLTVQLSIKLVPSTGELKDVSVSRSSGNETFDRNAIQAVHQAAPFSELAQQPAAVQKQFQQLTLEFKPDAKGQ